METIYIKKRLSGVAPNGSGLMDWIKSAERICALLTITVLLAGVFVVSTVTAQPLLNNERTDQNIQRAFHEIYNFRFDSAQVVIQRASSDHDNLAWYYFAASNMELWRIFSGALKSRQKPIFYENLDNLARFTSHLDDLREQRFLRVMYYTYKARMALTNKDYISTFSSLRNYYGLLGPIFDDDGYPPNMLVCGLYLYLADYAYRHHVLFRPLLSVYRRGNKEAGLDYLKKAANSCNELIATEAKYYLVVIYQDLEKEPKKALPFAKQLYNKYPGNFIFGYYYHKIMSEISDDHIVNAREVRQRVLNNASLSDFQRIYFDAFLKFRYPA